MKIVQIRAPGYNRVVAAGVPHEEPVLFTDKELDAGTLVPRPIKVGDRVTWGGGVVSYDVFGIREGYAVLTDGRCVDGTPYLHREMPFEVQPVSRLVRVSP